MPVYLFAVFPREPHSMDPVASDETDDEEQHEHEQEQEQQVEVSGKK